MPKWVDLFGIDPNYLKGATESGPTDEAIEDLRAAVRGYDDLLATIDALVAAARKNV